MIAVWIADAKRGEADRLEALVRRAAAPLSEEGLDCRTAVPDVLRPLLEQGIGPELACLDLELPEGLPFARLLRARCGEALMILIAPPELSPMEYLRPDILAAGLLLRPFTTEQAFSVLRDALCICLRTHTAEGEGVFWVEGRGEREAVRLRDILYFESFNKRISLVTAAREYTLSDTLDRLQQTLPAEFVRCHRSYIVRRDRIDRVRFAENLLYLDNGETIPVSRSYKSELKGAVT